MLRATTAPVVMRHRLIVGGACAIAFALLATMLFGSRGLVHLQALRREHRTLNDRITVLLGQNEQLRTKLQRLRQDDRYLERLARDQLGFIRRGEVVYRFQDRSRPDHPGPR